MEGFATIMGSVMDSDQWVCPGCYRCFSYRHDGIDAMDEHEKRCVNYKKEMKRREEQRSKIDNRKK